FRSVIKITQSELQRNQGLTIAQIINAKSGIEIAGGRGRDGDVLGVFARGGRGKQVLVLIDGVRVSDPSTFSLEYDLRMLSPALIESIEIIKGAASTLYGTSAATAVINIRTKTAPQEKIQGNFSSTVGTHQSSGDQNYNLGSIANSASISGRLDRFDYGLEVSNRYANGLSAAVTPENKEDPFSHFGANLRVGYRFTEGFDVKLYGNHTKFSNEYDDSGQEAPNLGKNQQDRVGMASTFAYGKGALVLNTAYSEYSTFSRDGFGESTSEGENWVVDLYNKYIIGDRWHIIMGVKYITDMIEFSDGAEFELVDRYATVVYVYDFGLNLNVEGRLNNHSEYGNHFVHNISPC